MIEDGPLTDDNHPEPITDREFELAMLVVRCRFPNCAFVIEKYLEQKTKKQETDR